MLLNIILHHDTRVRDAKIIEAKKIVKILSLAFEPYKKYYTDEAYNATVVSLEQIEQRIKNPENRVLVAVYHDSIVGTASVKDAKEGVYIQSMAILPDYQRKNIGWHILEEIQKIALEKKCKAMRLECSRPLVQAQRLYDKFGFGTTGRKRDYFGIDVFEMQKRL